MVISNYLAKMADSMTEIGQIKQSNCIKKNISFALRGVYYIFHHLASFYISFVSHIMFTSNPPPPRKSGKCIVQTFFWKHSSFNVLGTIPFKMVLNTWPHMS